MNCLEALQKENSTKFINVHSFLERGKKEIRCCGKLINLFKASPTHTHEKKKGLSCLTRLDAGHQVWFVRNAGSCFGETQSTFPLTLTCLPLVTFLDTVSRTALSVVFSKPPGAHSIQFGQRIKRKPSSPWPDTTRDHNCCAIRFPMLSLL